jgi:potassium-transporting ATPase KdpC subunit
MKNIIISVRLALITLFMVSVLYPLGLWVFASVITPHSAEGSLINGRDGKTPVGSELIAQKFSKPQYFRPRPSAADYNAAAAGASNFGPTNPKLTDRAKETLASFHPQAGLNIPSDLIAASGSGLDPHISQAAANYQAARVARHRHISESTLLKIIDTLAFDPGGLSGKRIVNVLQLNLELDKTLLGNSR